VDEERVQRIAQEIRSRSAGVSAGRAAREAALDALIEQDLRREQATSLGRVGRRIERAIVEMADCELAWQQDVANREEHAVAYAEARGRAI